MSIVLPQTAADCFRHIHKGAQPTHYLQGRFIEPTTKDVLAYSCRLDELGTEAGIDIVGHDLSGERHVYVNVGLADAPLERCMGSDDVSAWDVFFIDLDLASAAKPDRPASTAEAVEFLIQQLPIKPTLITESGSGGVHAFFSLNHPFFFALPSSRDRLAAIADGFQDWVHAEAEKQRGWRALDNVSDLARTHRCVFTLNIKPGVNSLCRPIWVSDHYYDIEQIEELAVEGVRAAAQRRETTKNNVVGGGDRRRDTLDQINVLWCAESKRRARKLIDDVEELEPNPAAIHTGCAFIRYAYDFADTLPEPEWFAALTVLGRTLGGDIVAHDASRPHAGYSKQQTDAKLAKVLAGGGPVTCDHIEHRLGFDGCATCPFRGRIASPISLGSRSADHVELLQETAYVARTNEFVHIDDPTEDGLDPSNFANLHAHRLSSADKTLLADGLMTKAHARTYRPDMPSGLIRNARGTALLNWYEPPTFAANPGSADLFFGHLYYLIADERERDILIKYLAHLVQKPWVKIRWSIGLVGNQRTGKNWVAENLAKKLLGPRNVNVVIGSRLGDRFDWPMAGGVLLTVDEVEIEERREVYERLKTLCTQDERGFERKGKDLEYLPTPKGIVFISNHKNAFHLPADDGRFFIIETADQKHPDGAAYYRPLFELTPEFVAGVRQALMAIDLSDFDCNTLPFDTKAKARMVENSKSDLVTIIQECLEERHGPFRREIVALADLRGFLRDRLKGRDVPEKRLREALLAAGVTNDPHGRQVRINDGELVHGRVRLWFTRPGKTFDHLDASALGKEYQKQRHYTWAPEDETNVSDDGSAVSNDNVSGRSSILFGVDR